MDQVYIRYGYGVKGAMLKYKYHDVNGRATVVSQLQSVINAMINEGKLVSGTASENTTYPSDGDYAYCDIEVIDKDSIEHLYLTYKFQFSSRVTE